MHAVTLTAPGDPDVLVWTEAPDPVPGPGEVLIEVAATAVNRADLLQRMGFYPPPPGASEILGLECSGRIAALGPDVIGWHAGDEVCALLSGGGYAELVVVPAGQCLRLPTGVDVVEAAALPEAGSRTRSRSSCMAAGAASAPWRSRSPMPSAPNRSSARSAARRRPSDAASWAPTSSSTTASPTSSRRRATRPAAG